MSDVPDANFGGSIEAGGEATIYLSLDGEHVIKSISLDYYDGEPLLAIDRILIHNYLFPETSLTDIGFGRDADGQFKILAAQRYVKGERAMRDEIVRYALERGFSTTDNNSYHIQGIKISDLNELNVIKGEDGFFHVIDAELRFETTSEPSV